MIIRGTSQLSTFSLAVWFVVSAYSQSQGNTGQVVGTVSDEKGAVIPNAKVQLRGAETGSVRDALSNAEGQYRLVLLPPAHYEITATARGFAPAIASDVEVSVGAALDLNFRLTTGALQQTLVVQSTLVETTRPEPSTLLDSDYVRDLPINGRRFQDLQILAPTATVELRRSQISLLGQRGINTSINIDGLDYTEPYFGGIRGSESLAFTVPQGAVGEFQVVSAAYAPEFGRSTGGIMTAVTNSGANTLHGSAFYLLRQKELGLKNGLNQQSLENRHQFGGSAGGRIIRNRLFWFGAAEQQFLSQPRAVLFPALRQVARTAANGEAYDFFRAQEQGFRQTNDSTAALGRVDYEFARAHHLSARHNYSHSRAENAISSGAPLSSYTTSALSSNGTPVVETNTTVAQLISVFHANLVNDFRFQYSWEQRPRTPNTISPTVSSVVGTFGTTSFLPSKVRDSRSQFLDDLNWQHGTHSIKAGFEFNYTPVFENFGFDRWGTFSFLTSDINSTLTLLSATPTGNRFDSPLILYFKQIGTATVDFAGHESAAFFQDNWRPRSDLTVVYGVRWERQAVPAPLANQQAEVDQVLNTAFPLGRLDPRKQPVPGNEFMPRIGLAWSPLRFSHTVFRLYAGSFYSRTPLVVAASPYNNFSDPPGDLSVTLPFAVPASNPNNTLYRQFQLIGVDLNSFALDKLPILTPAQISGIAAGLGIPYQPFQGAAPVTWAPNFKNPRALQWGGGAEREVAHGISIYGDFKYANTVHLTRNREYNLPLPFLRAGDKSLRPIYGLRSDVARPNPAFDSIKARESSARSMYRGATFGTRVQRKRYQAGLHYTYSGTYSDDDNERDIAISYDNAFNLRPEYGYSELDACHFLRGYGVVSLPWGIDLSGILSVRSGLPLNAVTGSDSNEDRDGARPFPTDRPYQSPGVPSVRNAFRNQPFRSVDVRFLKSIPLPRDRVKLQFSAEMFNIFNFTNASIGPNNTIYGLGVDPATGNSVAPPATFLRVKLADGRIDPNNTVGTPFQFQAGLRLEF